MKKYILLFIVFSISITLLSCGDGKPESPTEDKNSPTEEASDTESNKFERIDPNLPDMNFEGRDFNKPDREGNCFSGYTISLRTAELFLRL